MVFETIEQTGERTGAVARVAHSLGIGVESLRNWVRQAEIDRGAEQEILVESAAREIAREPLHAAHVSHVQTEVRRVPIRPGDSAHGDLAACLQGSDNKVAFFHRARESPQLPDLDGDSALRILRVRLAISGLQSVSIRELGEIRHVVPADPDYGVVEEAILAFPEPSAFDDPKRH